MSALKFFLSGDSDQDGEKDSSSDDSEVRYLRTLNSVLTDLDSPCFWSFNPS